MHLHFPLGARLLGVLMPHPLYLMFASVINNTFDSVLFPTLLSLSHLITYRVANEPLKTGVIVVGQIYISNNARKLMNKEPNKYFYTKQPCNGTQKLLKIYHMKKFPSYKQPSITSMVDSRCCIEPIKYILLLLLLI